MLDKLFRFSIKDGEIGGVVIAKNVEEAADVLKEKYNDYAAVDFFVWPFTLDDYYDEEYPNVIECYGM